MPLVRAVCFQSSLHVPAEVVFDPACRYENGVLTAVLGQMSSAVRSPRREYALNRVRSLYGMGGGGLGGRSVLRLDFVSAVAGTLRSEGCVGVRNMLSGNRCNDIIPSTVGSVARWGWRWRGALAFVSAYIRGMVAAMMPRSCVDFACPLMLMLTYDPINGCFSPFGSG